MNQFVQVVEDEGDDPIELPAEPDGTLLLSTLSAQFTGACGLKYRNPDTNVFRGVRLSDGKLCAPDDDWSAFVFTTVYPKEKRKGDSLENPASKTKKFANRCSDLIVLGLPWKSTEDEIKQHFAQFGEVIMVQVKRDPVTKQSKGYAFIRFSEYESQLKALAQRHNMDGRWCDLRIPNSKEGMQPMDVPQKVYVGRLTEDITADDLRNYFSQFGDVSEVFLPKPFRAFAFITFIDPEVASSLYGDDHIIKGVSVHVGNATPKGAEQQNRGGFTVAPENYGVWIPNNAGGKAGFGKSGGYGGRGGAAGGGGGYGSSNRFGGGGANAPGSFGFGNANPMQVNSAMMAAAQAALFGFMSQAAGGQAFGAGGANSGFVQPGYGGNSPNSNYGGGFVSGSRDKSFGSGGQQSGGAASNIGAYGTMGGSSSTTGGASQGAGGGYNGGYGVQDMDSQSSSHGTTRWS